MKEETNEIKLESYLKDQDIQNVYILIGNMTFGVRDAEKNMIAKRIITQIERYLQDKKKNEEEKPKKVEETVEN